MVALYCLPKDGFASFLRYEMFARGIPCALVGPTHGPASVLMKVPFVVFTSDALSYGEGVRRRLPPERTLILAGTETAADAVLTVESTYRHCFGVDYAKVWENGIRFEAGRVYYRGHYLPLTASEYRIVRLLFHCRGTYWLPEEISASCLVRPGGGAAVHICNINKKAENITLHTLIESRRYSGYRIP